MRRYAQYEYEPPPWHFLEPPRPRSPRGSNSMEEFFGNLKAWAEFQEEQEKKKKEVDKDKKKPPNGAQQMLSFLQWWAVMAVFGLPIGLLTLFMLNRAVSSIPAIIGALVK